MKISDFLSRIEVLVDVRASGKDQLLREVAHKAADVLGMPAEQISSALLHREELGSTGMGGGVAIPHARMEKIGKPLGILVRLLHPIDFGAIDGEDVDVVFALILPSSANAGPVGVLACVARKLRSPEVVSRMRQAKSADDLYAAMIG